MSALYPQGWLPYLNIFLVFLRLLGLFVFVPAFSHQTIPARVKLIMAIALSLAIYPIVSAKIPEFPYTTGGIIGAAFFETIIGLFMGFAAYITFESINLAAHYIGVQLGFGTVSLLDPQTHHESSVMVPWQGWITLMIFFFADMHHHLLVLFVKSFEATHTLTLININTELFKWFAVLSGKVFLLAIQMAAPFTLLAFCVHAVMGVLSRTLPQMNILLFSLPITLLLGFMALYLFQPELIDFVQNLLTEMTTDIMTVLRYL